MLIEQEDEETHQSLSLTTMNKQPAPQKRAHVLILYARSEGQW
jgi:hypothetical protein